MHRVTFRVRSCRANTSCTPNPRMDCRSQAINPLWSRPAVTPRSLSTTIAAFGKLIQVATFQSITADHAEKAFRKLCDLSVSAVQSIHLLLILPHVATWVKLTDLLCLLPCLHLPGTL